MLVTINDYEYENYIFTITREGLKGVSSCRDLSVRKYVQSVTLSLAIAISSLDPISFIIFWIGTILYNKSEGEYRCFAGHITL